ncbi:hypothetical protein DFH07DRAFT_838036 [Mycena maculata]|uniref:Uncharacterized protein n=1 Tax=Mycena maculata TaxID=230809 RepID=A0AAD7IEQ7_9AGAR|nr:hypothetical protein DFH07DRAFT_838036 [Mycena maculata]
MRLVYRCSSSSADQGCRASDWSRTPRLHCTLHPHCTRPLHRTHLRPRLGPPQRCPPRPPPCPLPRHRRCPPSPQAAQAPSEAPTFLGLSPLQVRAGPPTVRARTNASYIGCSVGNATVLQTCCAAVGSVPVFANNSGSLSCNCPFNGTAAQIADDQTNFIACAENISNATIGCSGVPSGTAVRWKTNIVAVVLGVAFLVGAMGL